MKILPLFPLIITIFLSLIVVQNQLLQCQDGFSKNLELMRTIVQNVDKVINRADYFGGVTLINQKQILFHFQDELSIYNLTVFSNVSENKDHQLQEGGFRENAKVSFSLSSCLRQFKAAAAIQQNSYFLHIFTDANEDSKSVTSSSFEEVILPLVKQSVAEITRRRKHIEIKLLLHPLDLLSFDLMISNDKDSGSENRGVIRKGNQFYIFEPTERLVEAVDSIIRILSDELRLIMEVQLLRSLETSDCESMKHVSVAFFNSVHWKVADEQREDYLQQLHKRIEASWKHQYLSHVLLKRLRILSRDIINNEGYLPYLILFFDDHFAALNKELFALERQSQLLISQNANSNLDIHRLLAKTEDLVNASIDRLLQWKSWNVNDLLNIAQYQQYLVIYGTFFLPLVVPFYKMCRILLSSRI